MLDLVHGNVKPDEEIVFRDGTLTIVSMMMLDIKTAKNEAYATVKYMCGDQDEPISLTDIEQEYPYVRTVIFEEALKGYVFKYGNHSQGEHGKNAEKWELVGTTVGYA